MGKLTGKTITDEQIKPLLDNPKLKGLARAALAIPSQHGSLARRARKEARAELAKYLNSLRCVQSMGCLCAGHARGNPASKPCDTREVALSKPCDTREVALTDRMRHVLTVLDKANRPLSPNEIARRMGYYHGHIPGKSSVAHNGRVMGPAQRIIFALIALRDRSLVIYGNRPDGLSGTAYEITMKGREALTK